MSVKITDDALSLRTRRYSRLIDSIRNPNGQWKCAQLDKIKTPPFTLNMLILPLGRSERSEVSTFEASKPYAKRRFCLHVSNDPKPLLGIMQCNLMSSAPWEEEAIERNAWEYRSLWLAVHSNSWHFFSPCHTLFETYQKSLFNKMRIWPFLDIPTSFYHRMNHYLLRNRSESFWGGILAPQVAKVAH